MDWLNKENNISDNINEASTEVAEESSVQNTDDLKEENSRKMEEKRAEREEEDRKSEDLLLAIDGAKIKFNSHIGEFKVLNDVPTTQGELTGTTVEKQIPNFIFDDGFQMISLTEWQDFGTAKVQDNYVLLKKSKLPGTGKMPGNSPPEAGNVEFQNSGQINMPESIEAMGAPVLEQKDDKYTLEVFYNEAKIKEEDFVFISSEPKMPKIKIEIKIGKDCIHKSLRFRLKTEFKFTASSTLYNRNDVDYFPIKSDGGNAFIIAEIGKTSWEVDFRGLFRGGTAYVEIWNEQKTTILKTFRFYIRGKNPTKEVVKQYMIDKGYLAKYWFIYKMALSESGSEGISLMKQFWDPEFVGKGKNRKEAVYGPTGRNYESKGIPNYGYPDGWGMCQIDFKYEKNNLSSTRDEVKEVIKNPDYIWNWKENIAVKMNIKLPEKIKMATAYLKKLFKNVKELKSFSIEEGDLIYKTCPSTIPELQQFNSFLKDKATSTNEKSILDAEIIKLYNGGHYITSISSEGILKIEQKNSLGFNYNERIGKIKE